MPWKMRERLRIVRNVRNAIEHCPDGICFSSKDGRPILVNRKMNEISLQVTGHTVLNMNEFWEYITRFHENSAEVDSEEYNVPVVCRLSDESVWQFQKQIIQNRANIIIQTTATDISELYASQKHLLESISQEKDLHRRQRELLEHIVQNNLDRELLNAKIRIHDDFGRVLLMTKNWLQKPDRGKDEEEDIFSEWRNVIIDMENAATRHYMTENSSEKELILVAKLIGCRLEIIGSRPTERGQQLLLFAAIREALTNAVRHAGADRLWVEMSENRGWHHVEIRSNGDKNIKQIKEGSGLGNLRMRLEREGILMHMDCSDGVVMILDMPVCSEEKGYSGESR